MTARALLLIKPDGVRRGLVTEAVTELGRAGLVVTRHVPVRLTEHQAAGLWAQIDPAERPVTAWILHRYLVGRPSHVLHAQGPDACARALAVKKRLRHRHGDLLYANGVHSPDTDDETAEQAAVLAGADPAVQRRLRPPDGPWHGWPAETVTVSVGEWWHQAARHTSRPTRWAPPAEPGTRYVRVFVPARWVIALDSIIAFLGDLSGGGDLTAAIGAAMAALYDRTGFPLPVRSAAHAREVTDRVREFGLIAGENERPGRSAYTFTGVTESENS